MSGRDLALVAVGSCAARFGMALYASQWIPAAIWFTLAATAWSYATRQHQGAGQ